MKKKYSEKLKKYVEKNRLSKVKHLRRKHDLDMSEPLYKDKSTLLHKAYEFGFVQIAWYLQKHGCSLMTKNLDGDLPLHKACLYFIKNPRKSVYESMIVPMTTACPESLTQRNKFGVTCEELLQQAWVNHKHKQSPVVITSDSDSDSVDFSEEENTKNGRHRTLGPSAVLDEVEVCIESGDLAGLKRLSEHPQVTLQILVFRDSNTPLHTAAEWGQDRILRYLLKEGCDPLLVNCDGDLPLHKACCFAKETDRPYAYWDLVEPLVRAAPDSVNVENNRGVTCRGTVNFLKARAMEENAREDSGPDSGDEEGDFCRKLFEEMMSEYGEAGGQYEQDFGAYGNAPENTDAWMDRMAQERKRKCHRHTEESRDSKQKKAGDNTNSGTNHGHISNEQKAEFNKKLKAQYAQETAKNLRKKSIERRLKYELKCDSVFKKKSISILGFSDIPWPHDPGKEVDSVIDFLFENMDAQSVEYAKYVRVQQVRWHPDRFLQRCGERLREGDRERVVKRVNRISQVLNAVST